MCKPCAKHNGVFAIAVSFGPCEVCDIISDCFDVSPVVLEDRLLSVPRREDDE